MLNKKFKFNFHFSRFQSENFIQYLNRKKRKGSCKHSRAARLIVLFTALYKFAFYDETIPWTLSAVCSLTKEEKVIKFFRKVTEKVSITQLCKINLDLSVWNKITDNLQNSWQIFNNYMYPWYFFKAWWNYRVTLTFLTSFLLLV